MEQGIKTRTLGLIEDLRLSFQLGEKIILRYKKKGNFGLNNWVTSIFLLNLMLFIVSCNSAGMPENPHNHLKNESSLYLQQHANNPVNWYPWSDEAWSRAKKENKLVLVSIGYSSCHWCHVMERETFMDTASARIMNEKYICIKVDREERPDIDQVYMSAVQLMTGSGGWPLNCFTLPDGRPIYGGTYFPNANWKDVLFKLSEFYTQSPDKAKTYADELAKGIGHSELIKSDSGKTTFSNSTIKNAVEIWKPKFDNIEGGPDHAPKFPLPGNYQFLMRYAVTTNDQQLLKHVELTLNKMAFGGIYDHLAGGFARYSTDLLWKAPHFEKMLYDNAQLVSLYSSAYKLTGNDLYKNVVLETLDFLTAEMSDGNGGYYSAIDADSEGEEGKYYVWTLDEIKKIIFPKCGTSDGLQVLSDYYSLNDDGHWEKDRYILLRKKSDKEIQEKYKVSASELKSFLSEAKSLLKSERNKRERPLTDKKIITSWNALQISALCAAYESLGLENIRTSAINSAKQLLQNAMNDQGILIHVRSQKGKMNSGYLDDYAFTITAFINLYSITYDESWLHQAKKLADDAIKYYYDSTDGFFWYTSSLDTVLISRKKETTDNVIPASNSEMALALFLLGDLYDNKDFSDKATRMLASVDESITRYPSSFSNWLNVMMNYSDSFSEVVIAGENADNLRKDLSKNYFPFAIIAGSIDGKSQLPILEDRWLSTKTLIYICKNKTCKLPLASSKEAIAALKADFRFYK